MTAPLHVVCEAELNVIWLRFSHRQDRSMVQEASCQSLTMKLRVRSRANQCEVCGGKSGSGKHFCTSTSSLSCHCRATVVPLSCQCRATVVPLSCHCRSTNLLYLQHLILLLLREGQAGKAWEPGQKSNINGFFKSSKS